MADKSFEQQVQENLAGLRMKPDMAVWFEVERALHKERKRRWLIWVVLLAAGSATSFLAYENFSSKAPGPEIITINPITSSIKPTIKEKDSVTVNETITNKIEESSVISNTPEVNAKIVTNKILLTTVEKTNESSIKQLKTKAVASISTAVENKEAKLTGKDNLIVSTSGKKSEAVTESPAVAIATKPATGIDSTYTQVEIKLAEEIPPVKTDSGFIGQQQSVVKVNKKNPWMWNINLDAGKSGLRSGLTFGKSSTEMLVAAPGTGLGNSGNAAVGTPPAPLLTVPPTIKDAFSFGLQLEATKKIGKKNSLGISAGYLLMQTKNGVGRRIDSMAINSNGYYYTNTDSIDYTNQYHFLQLGANYYIPFRLFKAVSFRWQLGMGLNFLIATNGLHYDASNRHLYENSSLFTKTQVYTSTGLDLAIGKQPFLYIGPHWLYSFSTLSEQGINSKHLTRFAIQASYVLPKKKK